MNNFLFSISLPFRWLRKFHRKRKLLYGVNPASSLGLEIGPLDKPVIKRGEGRPIFYADIASKEILMQRCHDDPNVVLANVRHVDFVWGSEPLRKTIPASFAFDYVIASHVIEHATDMIGWLNQIAEVMKPHGILSLAIPDKRFTFDRERETTTIDQLVEAHAVSGISKDQSGVSWAHNFVFTFDTFREIVRALCCNGTIPFQILALYRPVRWSLEFIVILQRL
jgi:SAM-dependent methyltransferase